MNHLIRLVAGAAILLFLPPSPLSGFKAVDDPPKPLRKPRPEPKTDTAGSSYWGKVTEITKRSISIQFDNQKDQKPKKFLLSETMPAGKIPTEPRLMPGPRIPFTYRVSPTAMYRITDVKLGDWVAIKYAHVGDLNICDHICIQKRPGGRVPPLPEEAEALAKPSPPPPGRPAGPPYIPYHERINAYWDLEDKGIPYPEKFGKKRRFPVGPMPRKLTLDTPAISQ